MKSILSFFSTNSRRLLAFAFLGIILLYFVLFAQDFNFLQDPSTRAEELKTIYVQDSGVAQMTDNLLEEHTSSPIPPNEKSSNPVNNAVPVTQQPSESNLLTPPTPEKSTLRSVATSSPTNALATSSPTNALATSSPTKSLATSSPTNPLVTSSPTHSLATSSPTHSLATSSPTHSLATSSPTNPLVPSSSTNLLANSSTINKIEASNNLSTEGPTSKSSSADNKAINLGNATQRSTNSSTFPQLPINNITLQFTTPFSTNSSSPREDDIELKVILKDTRPLKVTTPLVPNATLWKYPDFNKLPSNGIDGPFYSQTAQDRYLYSGFFRNLKNGTFIELGAVDGVSYSNTKFFQDKLGWNGLLIEPSNDFEYLQKGISRYSTSARAGTFTGLRCLPENKVYCINKAICRKPGKIEFIDSSNSAIGNMVGGAKELLTPAHKSTFHITEDKTYEVECVPIATLLKQYGIKRVDLFSLDVEGAEEIVLDTFDWSIPVHVIVIESHDYNSPTGPEGHERKHRILMEKGFKFLMFHMYDEWWVNPANERL